MSPSLLNFLPNAVSQNGARIFYAEVTTPAPETFTDPLQVVLPDWSNDIPITITDWPAVHGSTLPSPGDAALLIADSRGFSRCVWLAGETLAVVPTPASWIAPTLINSWVNNGGGFETVGYLKDALGFVHLRGVITTGLTSTIAFVLPAGYRPGATTFSAVAIGSGAAGQVQVDASGNVTPFHSGGATSVGLSGTTFLAEN